ncbi:MAG TPA: hypothetical protein ENI61_02010 [Ignavibacteria bacterium]|nr:hypothetical protein [Ignavibacteria bacterium]
MKKNVFLIPLVLLILSVSNLFGEDTTFIYRSNEPSQDKIEVKSNEHSDIFVHPFFSHMALADNPGEVSFRFTGIQRREGENLSNDFGLHIEAGLLSGLGLHLRTDGIKNETFSELMLMYNVVTTDNENFGISIFGQLSIPTGSTERNTYKGLFGVGIKKAFHTYVVFNGDIHYDPKDDMAEYEGSFVFKASDFLYPIIEARGEITPDGTSVYLLPAIKFRIQDNQTIGVGFQIALADEREYGIEAVLQYGIEF